MKIIAKTIITTVMAAMAFASCSKKSESAVASESNNNVAESAKEVPSSKIRETIPLDILKYTLTDDGTGVKITGITDYTDIDYINLPDTIEGLPVKEFYVDMRKSKAWIRGYSFPDTVTKITNCYGTSFTTSEPLEYLKLPASLQSEKGYEKYRNPYTGKPAEKGQLVQVPSIEGGVLEFPEGIESVNLALFKGKKLILPSTIKNFEGDGLEISEIEIPESVTSINFDYVGEYYRGGKILTENELPARDSFKGCKFDLATQAKLKKLGYKGKF